MQLTSSTSTKSVPLTWVESLFARMQAMYGNKFLDMWRDTNIDMVKDMWAEEMGKLTAEELRRGFAGLMNRDWPPSLPEYVKMCRPPIDPTVAFYEAVNGVNARERGEKGNWSHPAIFWAAAGMAYDLQHLTHSALKARWESAFAEQMERGEWAEIPEPALALPAPGKGKTDKQQAEKMMEKYKAQTAKDRTDHRAWIGKVLERQKRKDPTLPGIAIRMAKEALNTKAEG